MIKKKCLRKSQNKTHKNLLKSKNLYKIIKINSNKINRIFKITKNSNQIKTIKFIKEINLMVTTCLTIKESSIIINQILIRNSINLIKTRISKNNYDS